VTTQDKGKITLSPATVIKLLLDDDLGGAWNSVITVAGLSVILPLSWVVTNRL